MTRPTTDEILRRIAKLTAALLEIASMPSKPDGDIGYLWAAVECAHDALDLP